LCGKDEIDDAFRHHIELVDIVGRRNVFLFCAVATSVLPSIKATKKRLARVLH
jgi:hypothetical protein